MADAGLTHGGFYSHFSSKEDLVGEAVRAAFDQTRPQHRDRPERGCAAAPLLQRSLDILKRRGKLSQKA
jgi:TetR/AcrR family transcriptional regulator, transcriptional repressor for nem operon